MSDVKKTYDDMWVNAIQRFKNEQYEVDHLINSAKDTRRGITILSYLNNAVAVKIAEFLDELKEIEPAQYYYPKNEFHLTVLSIITCVENFKLSDIDVKAYSDAFKEAVKNIGTFKVKYSGVTASPSCILVQGFPEKEQLNTLRSELRLSFKKAKLHTSIDVRYEISTAHSTVVRFSTPLRNRDEFLKVLYKYRKRDFGTLEVDKLDLVFNDWYQDLSVTKLLSSCALGASKQLLPRL